MLLYILLFINYFQGSSTVSHTNFEVQKLELCAPPYGDIVIYSMNITKIRGINYLNYDLQNYIPLDARVGITTTIRYAPNGEYLPLFTIREKDSCKAANRYMGEFWYDIQRAGQVLPKTCPIPPGRYLAHNYPIDFKKLSLQTFPFGVLEFKLKLFDNFNSQNFNACLLMEGSSTESHTNFEIQKCEVCAPPYGDIVFYSMNITKTRGINYLRYEFKSRIPLDARVGGSTTIRYAPDGEYLPLFTIREKDSCKAADRYMGEFWYDMQRAGQILPKTCPIPPGRYLAHNYPIDFNKLALQTFPFGVLEFKLQLFDNYNSQNFNACILIEVKNILN